MATGKRDLTKQLEGVINRLEQVVIESTLPYDIEEEELGDNNIALIDEIPGEIEGAEASLLKMEGRIDELAQTIGEEIENLRRILEQMEEGD